MLEPPSAWNITKVVGISTGSEPRSQEVVARSGFGLYGLGWLRRFRRLNPPGNPISNSRFPRSDGFQNPYPRRRANRNSTDSRTPEPVGAWDFGFSEPSAQILG